MPEIDLEDNPGKGFRFSGINRQGYKEFKNLHDGMVFVMIPYGSFFRGSEVQADTPDDEQPRREIYLGTYYIGKYEVTNAQFAAFVHKTGFKAQGPWETLYNPGMDDYPVAAVSWDDAQAYCAWAGVRLPYEAEWEKAARGSKGNIYPWGNHWETSYCNNRKLTRVPAMPDIYKGRGSLPVGSFPQGASPYGCMDMAGNVWEWCADWYGNSYYAESPCFNPSGPTDGEERVLRGGPWSFGNPEYFRSNKRHSYVQGGCGGSFGFRCAFSKLTPATP